MSEAAGSDQSHVGLEAKLAQLEELLAEAKPVPLSSSIMLNRAEIDGLVGEIRDAVPEEVKQARWVTKERAERFRELPGLLQKYYIRHDEPGNYGGVYIWDSKASLMEFKESELAKTIGQAYKVVGPPEVDISDVLFQLRD